jgi:tubulin polyglutamylase TTLL9
MVKNLKRYKRQIEREQSKAEGLKCDFFPTTFVLPVSFPGTCLEKNGPKTGSISSIWQSEYHMFVEEFKRKPGTIWIMKPAGRAQGKGIFLFKDLKDITEWKKVIFSRFWNITFRSRFHLKTCFLGRNENK